MKSVEEEIENLTRIIKMIAAEFGPHCEVVLHDLTKSYEHTIVAIENGHVTGRSVGECGSNLGLEVLRGTETSYSRHCYVTRLPNGKTIKSSTTYLSYPDGKVFGAICVNFDITNIMKSDELLAGYEWIPPQQNESLEEIFVSNVGELLEHLLGECEKKIGRSPEYMSKEDKIDAVRFLDSKGAFLISKSGDRVCVYLGISKYTLYGYLDIVRKVNHK